ncbi:hypothetical protein MHC_04470 [Mycoplasma haemocanis str. Illinois]|uniref:Uncharacterized protein n=1 Tax=Mycoplasma haemocanis (strain Illinois) TaxID=1111676 RepID=H6N7X8_MYCHN|nr:hypothetical protein [Mycoplasma haemocanis]AEW45750.1 hypothetical protein MHC_04470 [Mycoplasma haemocanis str. Illinois]
MKKVTPFLTSFHFPLVLVTTTVGSYSSTPLKPGVHPSAFRRFFLFSDEKGEINYLFKHHKEKRYIDENQLRTELTKIVKDKFKSREAMEGGKLYYKIYKNNAIETVILWGIPNHFFDYFNFLLR